MQCVRKACPGVLAAIAYWVSVVHAQPSASISTPSVACPVGPSADLVTPALRDTRVVAFGEHHGTREIPRLVGDYLCALVRQEPHRPAILAWEFDTGEQARVDAFLQGPGRPEDIAKLLAGEPWQTGKDGRASQAGLALLERLRQLKAAGYPVSVELFVQHYTPGVSPALSVDDNGRRGERQMADTLLRALAAHPEARFVIEAGGLHVATRRDAWDPPRPGYIPMGQRLRQAGVDIVALEPIYAGEHNYHWACDIPGYAGGPVDPGMIRCGVYPGPPASAHHATPTIQLDAYDGTYFVGATSASPPAVDPGS